MAKDIRVEVEVVVTRRIQLNNYEPFDVCLSQKRADVSEEKAAAVRKRMFKELTLEAEEMLDAAIAKYRARDKKKKD